MWKSWIIEIINIWSEYDKERLSKKKKGRKQTEEHIKKCALARTGRKLTEETKQKIGSSNKLRASEKKLTGIEPVNHWIRNYEISDGEGNVYTCNNLKKFCRERGMRYEGLQGVVTGYRKHYKGWKVKRAGKI